MIMILQKMRKYLIGYAPTSVEWCNYVNRFLGSTDMFFNEFEKFIVELLIFDTMPANRYK